MVIVLRGCSGSGKSTYVASLEGDVVVHSADHFFYVDGEYCFDPSKLPAAHGKCFRDFIDSVKSLGNETTIVVDNTNTTMAETAPYAAAGGHYGHSVKIVTLVVDPEVAHARNQHGVPLATVKAQHKRLVESVGTFPPWWPEEVVK